MASRSERVAFHLLWLVLLGGLVLLWRGMPYVEAWFAPPAVGPRTVAARGDLAADEKATIELFEKARVSVVYITTRMRHEEGLGGGIAVPRGTGSGIIWDDLGHIVTNFHVIKGSSHAMIKLADGRNYRAALVGVSPAHELAVLRIGVGFHRLPPLPLGTSHDLKVGQKVYAIGNPFGLDWTLTNGIISAVERTLSADNGRNIEHLIQTDAPINPGNSGGPLLDSAGRLIGINTAIYSPTGANAGIGFAVPVDVIARVVPVLIRHGKFIRPTLGVEFDEGLNQKLTGLVEVQGVFVLRVPHGSAAEAAGLKAANITEEGRIVPGDIIIEIEGQRVTSVGKLLERVDDFKVGDTITLSILRNGKKLTIPLTLQASV